MVLRDFLAKPFFGLGVFLLLGLFVFRFAAVSHRSPHHWMKTPGATTESGAMSVMPVSILWDAEASHKRSDLFFIPFYFNSKTVITGDITQIDLPHGQKSGLVEAIERLRRIKGIGVVELTQSDIVRHKLVQKIVHAYRNDRSVKPKTEHSSH